MAEQVGKLTAHVGGNQYAHELLVPLEQLAAVEESPVSVIAVVAAASCWSLLSRRIFATVAMSPLPLFYFLPHVLHRPPPQNNT